MRKNWIKINSDTHYMELPHGLLIQVHYMRSGGFSCADALATSMVFVPMTPSEKKEFFEAYDVAKTP